VELVLLPRVAFRGREVAGARLGALLALLAEDLRSGCSTGRLVEGLWADERPEHPTRALQVLVSRARAQLGAETIASTPAGYRLTLSEEQVDAAAVVAHASAAARCARAGDDAGALAQAEAGLALWDGAPDEEDELGDPLARLRTERARTYRVLMRTRALALSRLDRRAEAVETLRDLLRDNPRDEEALAQLLLFEAATLGPSAALSRYETYRRGLREQLGSDPGAELQRVHAQLLERERPAVRRGVEYQPNALLGRDDDIAAVHQLLRTSRVVSIIGPGGLGKTRMAHAVAATVAQRAVHLIPLAGVTADADVVGEVASALGVGELGHAAVAGRGAAPDAAAGILAALGSGPTLLILDNCEHVLRGATELVRALVARSEHLRVLTTSRSPLGLSSESIYTLPALSLPTSAELFRQRAKAARPGVELPEPALLQLCERLDGLPLAVELAAARVRVMSVTEIVRRLDNRFALLRGAANDAPDRHRTLHAVIDWSWNLLAKDARAAMCALSIFPGGFTAEAAEFMLATPGSGEIVADVLDVLDQLVGQSLLQAADSPTGTRFRMLETVREFSAARRTESDAHGANDAVEARFLGWARGFGAAHHEALFESGLVESAMLTKDEQENLLLALRLGLARDDGASVAAACAVLGGLWMFESDFARMSALTGQTAGILAHLRPEPADVEVARTAAVMAIISALIVGHPAAARALIGLRRLPTAPPDTPVRAAAIVLTGVVDPRGGGIATLERLCASDKPMLAAIANTVATFVWQGMNEPDTALKAARNALASLDGHDYALYPWFRILIHSRIGELCLDVGRGDEAHEHFAATLSTMESLPGLSAFEIGSSVARVRSAMVLANLQRGAIDEAEQWLELTLREGGEQDAGLPGFDLVARAEILLARCETEAGLSAWRQAGEVLRDLRYRDPAEPFQEAWAREVDAMTVIAHAQHGRLALVGALAGRLPRIAAQLITDAADGPLSYAEFPHLGKLLLAVAVLDLDRGRRTGDARATRSGARMIALAEGFRVKCGFEPTMSVPAIRRMAEEADEPAYAEAVSAYTGLDANALRSAACAAVRAREEFTGPNHA
jgi:predicted ATPase